MKAVIMAGGFGTRLRPLTYNIPKPMAPVFNKPMMEHIILLLKKYGIRDVNALLYFQPHIITDYFKDGKKWGINLRYVQAESDFGTAGSVKNAEEFLNERFIIISGDVLTDFDLNKIIEFHEKKGAEATIGLIHHPNPLQFGVVITGRGGKITRFLEKPSWGQVFSDTINTGIYILEPEVLQRIPPGEEFDFSKDLFPAMLRAGAPLYGYVAKGYWKDIGNLNEYQLANSDALKQKVKLNMEEYDRQDGIWIHKTAQIDPTAKIQAPSVIGPHCRIKEEVSIKNSVIGAHCKIENHSRIQDSVLWDYTKVDEQANLTKDVVGYRSHVGKSVYISENCFISDEVEIGAQATVKANIKIWPQKEVEEGATVTSSIILGDRWLRELFTESKVSGLVNSEITPEFASKLGAALGAMAGMGKTVLVARDSSTACRMVNRGIINGLMSTGISVFDLRNVPIPIMRHQLRSFPAAAGVISRLSPRHPEYVEIVFLDRDGNDLPVNKRKAIERLFFGEDFFRAPSDRIGQIDFPIRVTEQYQFNFLNSLNAEAIRKQKFKVVIDFSFGGASTILPAILGRLGVNVVALNAFLEGHRLENEPNTLKKSIEELQKIVPILEADLGFILNASAEKIRVVDDKGKSIDQQRLALLVSQMVIETYKYQQIAFTVDINNYMEEICRKHNCELIYTTSDHQGLMNAVLKEKVPFAAGTRGGFIFSDFNFTSDGMYNIARILEMIAISGKSLEEELETIPALHMKTVAVPCPWEKKGQVMRNIMKHTEGKKRFLIDGVRMAEKNGSVLFIPDKEKASFYIQVDAHSDRDAEELLNKYEALMETWKN